MCRHSYRAPAMSCGVRHIKIHSHFFLYIALNIKQPFPLILWSSRLRNASEAAAGVSAHVGTSAVTAIKSMKQLKGRFRLLLAKWCSTTTFCGKSIWFFQITVPKRGQRVWHTNVDHPMNRSFVPLGVVLNGCCGLDQNPNKLKGQVSSSRLRGLALLQRSQQ